VRTVKSTDKSGRKWAIRSIRCGGDRGLSGKLGHEGWQWLFIICGITSLPVGVIGYFFNPDFPENTRAFYLSSPDRQLAKQRLLAQNYKPLGASSWDRMKNFRIIKQWQFWLPPFGYFCVQSSFPTAQPAFALYLKSTGHSVYQINVWPTEQSALVVVVQIVTRMLSDSPLLNGMRWQAITFMQAGSLFRAVIIAVWTVPKCLLFVAYLLHVLHVCWCTGDILLVISRGDSA
jgi:ACS family pantothenate transporter-like MFS transporter